MARMAKTTSSTTLESRIQGVMSQIARDITAAVRQDFAAAIQRILDSGGAVSAPRQAATTPAARKPAGRKPRKAGRRGGRRSADDGTLDKVLSFVQAHPGLRNEQIRGQIGLPRAALAGALAKLRADGRLKTSGVARAMTYTVA